MPPVPSALRHRKYARWFTAERRAEPWFGLLWLYLAAALLTALEIFTSTDPSIVHGPLEVVAGLSAVIAVGLLRFGHGARIEVIGALVMVGGVLTSVEIHYSGGVPNAASLFYFWGVLYAFYVFSRRHALLQIALIAAQYAVVINLQPPPFSAVTHWATTIAAMLGAGLFVGTLKDRLDGRIERLVDDARTDPLTGLLNRRGLDQAVSAQLEQARLNDLPLSILIADLDHFKRVNDLHGHAAGDEALRRFAAIIDGNRRHYDTVARHGGEEFTLVLPATDLTSALEVAGRLRETVERQLMGGLPRMTVSFGVATFPDHGSTVEDLMRRADEALYLAKSRGRNRVVGVADTALAAAPAAVPAA
jgi:diguanylate cyclase (GGDEF)-like protein